MAASKLTDKILVKVDQTCFVTKTPTLRNLQLLYLNFETESPTFWRLLRRFPLPSAQPQSRGMQVLMSMQDSGRAHNSWSRGRRFESCQVWSFIFFFSENPLRRCKATGFSIKGCWTVQIRANLTESAQNWQKGLILSFPTCDDKVACWIDRAIDVEKN